jgi:hypothetical protein
LTAYSNVTYGTVFPSPHFKTQNSDIGTAYFFKDALLPGILLF